MNIADLRSADVKVSRVRLELGNALALVWTDTDVVFEHLCKVVERGTGDEVRLLISPRLHPSHVVTFAADGWTVAPSISCPDCGTHGYVRGDHWIPA